MLRLTHIRSENNIQFLLLVILIACLPFNFTRAFIFIPIGSVIIYFTNSLSSDSKKEISEKIWLMTTMFFVYFLWAIPFLIETYSFSVLEKALPFLAFPLVIAMTKVSSQQFKKVLITFVVAVIISYLCTLVKAYYNFLYSPSLWGRQSDFFFHVQLSEGLFNFHPTYYGLIGCIATLFAYNTFTGIYKSIIILLLTAFIFLLNARIILATQMGLISSFILYAIFNKPNLKTFVGAVGTFLILLVLLKLVTIIYDYPHRKIINDLGSSWERSFSTDVTDADGTIATRLAIWRSAIEVIKANPFLGVGLGRENEELTKVYKKNNVPFLVLNEYNAHNQLLSFLITFGSLGTIIILSVQFYFFKRALKTANVLYISFFIIILICCLTESIFNRLYGICIFSFFNAFLLLKDDE